MKRSLSTSARKFSHQVARSLLSLLPRDLRFASFSWIRGLRPDARLELKIADTQDELEAGFRTLHDAYVASRFMKPDPTGLRVTIYHALPTTTTLCAKWNGRVIGAISMIRAGVFGFLLQSVFNFGQMPAKAVKIAERSVLAIDPAFCKTGGKILFSLMKFMYEYCREYVDTRHIVIAVNPNKIEMYESLLFFERLQAWVVDNHDFANGAPEVGASLDLLHAPEHFEQTYAHKRERKNPYHHFVETWLPNTLAPSRRFFTTNDPVLTPAMMDCFFNQRTQVLSTLDDRQRLLLRSIYDDDAYAAVLPPPPPPTPPTPTLSAKALLAIRQHQRFSIRCPARLSVHSYGAQLTHPLQVIELSTHGFQAECACLRRRAPAVGWKSSWANKKRPSLRRTAERRLETPGAVFYGFSVSSPDTVWRICVEALQRVRTRADLDPARAAVAKAGSVPPAGIQPEEETALP